MTKKEKLLSKTCLSMLNRSFSKKVNEEDSLKSKKAKKTLDYKVSKDCKMILQDFKGEIMKKLIIAVIFVCMVFNVAWGQQKYSLEIISDESFSGDCFYSPEDDEVVFIFSNDGKRAYLPKKLVCSAWTKDETQYVLELTNFDNDSNLADSYIMNPDNRILIICKTPTILRTKELQGFSIWLGGERVIRFGYEKLSIWQKIWRPIYNQLPEDVKIELNNLKHK